MEIIAWPRNLPGAALMSAGVTARPGLSPWHKSFNSSIFGGISVGFGQRVPPFADVATVDPSAAQHRLLPANAHHVHVHGSAGGGAQETVVEQLDEADWRKVYIADSPDVDTDPDPPRRDLTQTLAEHRFSPCLSYRCFDIVL